MQEERFRALRDFFWIKKGREQKLIKIKKRKKKKDKFNIFKNIKTHR